MIEPTEQGWLVAYNNRFYHITEAWCEEMFRHQIKPRKAKEDGRDVLADGEKAFNKLRYAVTHDGSGEDVYRLLVEFREALTGNLKARRAHGLKPVTKDGDEDLRAVTAGEPVRPWNAKPTRSKELDDFVRRARETRK
jgi:hypothetical protein